MANDLVKEFFARDLSDAELGKLRDRLSSEDEALRFSDEAKAFHKALGAAATVAMVAKLARTSAGASHGSGAGAASGASAGMFKGGLAVAGKALAVKAALVVVTASMVGATGIVAYHALHVPVLTVKPHVASAPPVVAPKVVHAKALAPVAPSAPLPQTAEQRGKQLVIRLTLEEPASVDTTVQDADGRFICSLGTWDWGTGEHRLVWTGRAANGAALAPGRYQIVIKWGDKSMVRWVELQPGAD